MAAVTRRGTTANGPGNGVLDETSKAIIEQLQQDGRRAYATIGKAVGLSEAAVRQRVQRLLDSGAMQIVAVTNPLELGFSRQAMIGIHVDGPVGPIADELAAMSEIDYVVMTAGSFDILAEVVCESDEELLQLLSVRIRVLPRRAVNGDVRLPAPAQADLLMGCAVSTSTAQSSDYRSLSLWHETADDDWTPRPSLPGATQTDVAIVGAGFTGLWTAYHLMGSDPSLRVTVLEREVAGFGASGRNGGWCSALFPASARRLAATASGRDGAVRMLRALQDSVRQVGEVAATEGIDAHYARGGTVTLARTPVQLRRLRADVTDARRWDQGPDDLVLLDADQARARLAATDVLGGQLDPALRRDPSRPSRSRTGARRRTAGSSGARAHRRPHHRPAPGAHRRRSRRRGGGDPSDRGIHQLAERAPAHAGPGVLADGRHRTTTGRGLGPHRAREPGDVHRRAAPAHLRAAHRRWPAGLRRTRCAVPLRVAGAAGLRP
jgi:DNA-binding Lrp family transcriptional regulator